MFNQFFEKLRLFIQTNSKILIILFGVFIIILFLAFKQCNEQTVTQLQKQNEDICLNLNKKYSDYIIDSLQLDSCMVKYKFDEKVNAEIKLFYSQRAYQFAWFNECGLISSSNTFHDLTKTFLNEFYDKTSCHELMDSLIYLANEDEKKFLTNWGNVRSLEFLLTANFFKYSSKIYGGTAENPKKLSWFIPRHKRDYTALLDSMISSTKESQFIEPLNPYYISLKKKLIEYKQIEKIGGFDKIEFNKVNLKAGDTNSAISSLKKVLFRFEDWHDADTSPIFTRALHSGVQHYQSRMGLPNTGILDKKTIEELNTPLSIRIKQILVNLERLRWAPSNLSTNFLLVNIPEYKLHIMENGKPLFSMNVIVGKTMHMTIVFEGKISSVVLNPYWNIPKSIVEKEIRKHMNRDKNYLSRNNMEIVRSGKEILYRQKPGNKNALGKIKFLFPNHYNIYLHDAPAKSLFEANTRAFSHGCIRVAEARKLALYILNKQEAWSDEKLDAILATNKEKYITISPTVPVFIAYFTTWVDHLGAIHFRKDVYGLDKRLELEIFGDE
jgi:murein L,D-transpeptidase YcbB/YkuD